MQNRVNSKVLTRNSSTQPARWTFVAGLLNCAVITAAALGFLYADSRDPDVLQPIAFNHRFHIEEVEVECTTCHAGLSDPSEPKIPTLEMCSECHTDTVEDVPDLHPELVKLAKLTAEETEIRWVPLFTVPDHVFFPHARHTDIGELECTECHADMPMRTTPPTTRKTITMEACIACHELYPDRPAAVRARHDCASCHH